MISEEIQGMLKGVPKELAETMDGVAEAMVKDMKGHLMSGNHIDTGKLITSIHADTTANAKEIITDIYIDAKSDQGTWYAEFLEFGTGIYNEDGTGRKTPWAWKDREGNWHTTRGMEPDPFIRPSIAAHEGELDAEVSMQVMDLKRYKK